MLTTGIVAVLLAYGPVPPDAPVRSQAPSFELASDARWPTDPPPASRNRGLENALLTLWGVSLLADLVTGGAMFFVNDGSWPGFGLVFMTGLASMVVKPLLLGLVAGLIARDYRPGGRAMMWAYLGEVGAVGLVLAVLTLWGNMIGPHLPIAFFAAHGLLVPALAGLAFHGMSEPGLKLRWNF